MNITAFPMRPPAEVGMTLRDYFAAQAMQALLSRSDHADRKLIDIAYAAYVMADDMIHTRGG